MKVQIIFSQNSENTERATDKPTFGVEKNFFKHNTSGLQSNFKPINVETTTINEVTNIACKDFFAQISKYKAYYNNIDNGMALKHKWQKDNFMDIRQKNKLAKSVCNGLNKANNLLINKDLCDKLLSFYQKYSPINIVWSTENNRYEPYEVLSEVKEGYKQIYGKGIHFNENFYIHVIIDNVSYKPAILNDSSKANRLYLPNLEAKTKREFAKQVHKYLINTHKLMFPLEYLSK